MSGYYSRIISFRMYNIFVVSFCKPFLRYMRECGRYAYGQHNVHCNGYGFKRLCTDIDSCGNDEDGADSFCFTQHDYLSGSRNGAHRIGCFCICVDTICRTILQYLRNCDGQPNHYNNLYCCGYGFFRVQ